METKRCSDCKQEKPISHFRQRDGRGRMCSACRLKCSYYKRGTSQWIDKIVSTLKPKDY